MNQEARGPFPFQNVREYPTFTIPFPTLPIILYKSRFLEQKCGTSDEPCLAINTSQNDNKRLPGFAVFRLNPLK